jgi:hypothetical protein
VTYGSGAFSGKEFKDTVTLAPSLVITNQDIGVASQSEGFDEVDGILGFAYTLLSVLNCSLILFHIPELGPLP